MAEELNYSLQSESKEQIPAPDLPYRPSSPKAYKPGIGFIGAGGITEAHMEAYVDAGFNVTAICDLHLDRAEARQEEFYPEAEVMTDYRELLKREDVDVVDIATHPPERLDLIEASLRAGKHVLSQKPFVLDLDAGNRLADIADEMHVKLAVNQNGRWAPHVSYMRNAVEQGLIGKVMAVHVGVHWDHSWTTGTPFEDVHHLILYDFAIHWFDMLHCYMGNEPAMRVFASNAYAPGQTAKAPLLGQALVEFETGQASLIFDGYAKVGSLDRTVIVGTEGMLCSTGPSLSEQTVILTTEAGDATPELEGGWFNEGFHGTMGELLCAIEEGREPSNSARNNLRSLATCFAAIRSADTGEPQRPGEVRTIE